MGRATEEDGVLLLVALLPMPPPPPPPPPPRLSAVDRVPEAVAERETDVSVAEAVTERELLLGETELE